jgi:excisionase family DNA binding protein
MPCESIGEQAEPTTSGRNLGTAKQACALAGVTSPTLRNWLRQGLISAVRVGNGPYRYDLNSVAAVCVEYPRPDVDAAIRELVNNAPEPTTKQLNEIRLLLHASPERGGETA